LRLEWFEQPDPSSMIGADGRSLVKHGYVGRWVRADNARRQEILSRMGAEDVIAEDGNPLVGPLGRAVQILKRKWDEFSRAGTPPQIKTFQKISEVGCENCNPDVAPDIRQLQEFLRGVGIKASVADLSALEARDAKGWHTVESYTQARVRFGLEDAPGVVK
jgi:hypothetical protein